MAELVDYIDAVFVGENICFRLLREQSVLFEGEMSAFQRFQLFAMGKWRTEDIRHVLSFSHPNSVMGICPESDIAMSLKPTGTFMPLAVLILEAYLFGVPESKAKWDENDQRKTTQ